jgi:hypothetical protein
MRKESFKPTPIPHRTKFGEPMAYYTLSDDGKIHTEVSRSVCLARIDEPNNPFPQRWYVDEESGLVVRLPRNQKGEELARDNMRYIWREDKKQERKASCIAKCSNRCPITCSKCPMDATCESKHKAKCGLSCVKKCESCSLIQTREVELDKTYTTDSGDSIPYFEPADEFDIASVLEEKALLDTLYAALATLARDDLDLIKDIFWHGKTERELAPLLGYKQSKSVNKRKHKILETLYQNEALKDFFK